MLPLYNLPMRRFLLPADAARMVYRLARGEFTPPSVEEAELPPLETALRVYQARRLATTHADFEADPEFGPAARFFLTDIYAARDFSRRDAELEALYDFVRPVMPAEAIESMANAVALNNLTRELDRHMVQRLEALGATDSFSDELYAAAYRQGSYDARITQIDLVVTLLRQVAGLRHVPFIGTALHATRGAAQRMGWATLHSFLVRGYDAWNGVPHPEHFINAVESRERALNDHLFGRTTE